MFSMRVEDHSSESQPHEDFWPAEEGSADLSGSG
jgi:hypothetical protein